MNKFFASVLLLSLPVVASAQQLQPLQNFAGSVGRLVAALVPILVTIALVVFIWGLVRYIWGGTKADHAGGRKIMIAGLISLFVIVSVWGIIFLAQDALGINRGAPVQSPGVPVPGATGSSSYYEDLLRGTTNY